MFKVVNTVTRKAEHENVEFWWAKAFVANHIDVVVMNQDADIEDMLSRRERLLTHLVADEE